MAYDEGLAEILREALAEEPGIDERRMFGGLALLLDGHVVVYRRILSHLSRARGMV